MRIAVCDDDETAVSFLRELIETYPKQKLCADGYSSGEDLLRSGHVYDLIFLDIHMKYQDGMTTAKRIREVDADAQIVFITALAQYAIEGYKVNALDFILKPVVYEQLAMTMDKVLAVTSKYHKEKQLLGNENARYLPRIFYILRLWAMICSSTQKIRCIQNTESL